MAENKSVVGPQVLLDDVTVQKSEIRQNFYFTVLGFKFRKSGKFAKVQFCKNRS